MMIINQKQAYLTEPWWSHHNDEINFTAAAQKNLALISFVLEPANGMNPHVKDKTHFIHMLQWAKTFKLSTQNWNKCIKSC